MLLCRHQHLCRALHRGVKVTPAVDHWILGPSIAALESVGEVKAGETVLVTAAAGGTGQFAVQLAKLKGCRVIATCSGGAKEQLLKDLGADR